MPINVALVIIGVIVFLLLVFLGLLILGYFRNKKLADKQWFTYTPEKINNLGSVKRLRITPLIDCYSSKEELKKEPGVSYLVQADDNTILLDVGYNRKNEDPSPLLYNMNNLGVDFKDIRYIFISHCHLDHTGGFSSQKKRTFKISRDELDMSHVIAFVPTFMRQRTAQVKVIEKPQVLMPGVATEGPINRSIFFGGMTAEQALVINVSGKGLVILVGCGHQGVKRIIERAEQIFNEPIYGLIGGLHYPVTCSRLVSFGLPVQKMFGTGKLPWQRITKEEVMDTITFLKTKEPKLVSISAHDSCDWTLDAFRNAFGSRYQDLQVGLPIVVEGNK
jgi:7,8-dihydropterin-6-yl-methyl-4-(beta-D-ribofuranosyl)aminobenzene 5'-phosphate synthase